MEMMEKQIEAINAEVEERMRPFQPGLDLIDQIPGIARDGAHFVDLGPEHWDQRHKESVARRSIRRLEQLGYKVTIEAGA